MEAYLAAAKGGFALVPINYRLIGREVAYIINNSEPITLIYEEEYQGLVKITSSDISSVKNFIPMSRYEELISKSPAHEPEVLISEEDIVCIMYTSGTTGLPKGAVMTHKNWLSHTVNMVLELNISSEDVTLNVTPFFHVATIWPMLTHLYMGGTNVILSRFEPKAVLETLERERITTCNLVPTMIIQMLECSDINRYDLSSIRWLGYGASPMPVEVLRRAIAIFGKKLVQVYGLTEACPLLTLLPAEEHILEGPKARRLTSCGREIINVEVRVVDEGGKDVAPGRVGEIIARGDIIIKGYWRMPEETASTIRDGWLYTGDLATVDEEGYIYIVDRKKDIIISGGENISSREVEEALYSHPAVLEAAVIGVPDKVLGEAVKAVVVLKEGVRATEAEIIEHCKGRLAGYKRPRSVDFVESLPKSAAGKILKRELRERYWKGYERRVR